ncbi:ribbon-helix-helix domain-containing protein [Novosphingobium clariflavum]|uniref:Ribbon-helix-helix domain-containing protein n=1 Tax=Novosphingobium clariflavum TaxID=2029884 RepID=A0ABV6SHM0_9SPHN|nr:ribbon-helix-helix domain-containing protein [Novosphingobium clariflavum]
MSGRKGSLLALRDRDPAPSPASAESERSAAARQAPGTGAGSGSSSSPVAPSRQGKKAMTGYFSPEMSFAMHMTARKHGMSLQDAMAEAFNDWLRKMGESPVGK